MTKITDRPFLLQPGQSWTLPGGRGKITFTGYKQWVSLAVTYDPGQVPALVCGMLALGRAAAVVPGPAAARVRPGGARRLPAADRW